MKAAGRDHLDLILLIQKKVGVLSLKGAICFSAEEGHNTSMASHRNNYTATSSFEMNCFSIVYFDHSSCWKCQGHRI